MSLAYNALLLSFGAFRALGHPTLAQALRRLAVGCADVRPAANARRLFVGSKRPDRSARVP